jgi:hypothetical protein
METSVSLSSELDWLVSIEPDILELQYQAQ